MHLRPIERRDLAQVANIAKEAFIDDPRTSWLYPRARDYPEQFRASSVERFRRRLVQRQVWGLVAVSDAEDTSSATTASSDEVTAYALWERCNAGDLALPQEVPDGPQSNGSFMAALDRMLLRAEDRYATFFHSNEAIDYKRQAMFRQGLGLTGPSVKLPAHWFLVGVSVHSAWQRKGIGQQLLQWGLDQARKEDVPVILSATPEGFGLYKKNGFKVVDALGLTGDLPAEPVLIWDPKERWIRKLEDSDPSEIFGIPVEVAWNSELPAAESKQ